MFTLLENAFPRLTEEEIDLLSHWLFVKNIAMENMFLKPAIKALT